MRKGLFITVEGGEGVGKSTLIRGIATVLEKEGQELLLTREPGGPALCEEIRQLILVPRDDIDVCQTSELLLFLASRAQNIEEQIRPALEAGKTVICDRLNDSTIAYQGAGRGFDIEKVEELCQVACNGILPQLTFLLDLDPEEGLKRAMQTSYAGLDRIEQEALDFHRRVRQAFLDLSERYPERIHVLDARKEPSDLVLEAMKRIQTCYA